MPSPIRSGATSCSPGYGIKDGQLGLVDDPVGVIQGIGRVLLRGLGVFFRLFDVMLVALAVNAVVHGLHFGGGIGFHRLPLASRAVGGLLTLVLHGILPVIDIRLGVAQPRLDLIVSFLPAFFERILQVCCFLLQGIYLVGNGHGISPRFGSTGSSSMTTGR